MPLKRRYKSRKLLFSLLILLSACISAKSSDSPPSALLVDISPREIVNSTPSPQTEFGLSFPPVGLEVLPGILPELQQRPVDVTVSALQDLSLKRVRFAENWRLRQKKDAFHWQPLRERFNILHTAENPADVFLTVQTDGPPAACGQRNKRSCVYTNLEAFDTYINQLLGQDLPGLRYLQFGNEMLSPDFFVGTPEDYLKAQLRFARIAREQRPDVPVVLGGFSAGTLRRYAACVGKAPISFYHRNTLISPEEHAAFCQKTWVQRENLGVQTLLKKADYDVVDLHMYDDPESWSALLESIQATVRTLQRPGHGEIRYVVSEFGGPHLPREPDDENYQAAQLEKYLIALKALPVEGAYFFKLVPDGLRESPHYRSSLYKDYQEGLPLVKKPAYDVFKNRGKL